MWDYSMWKFPGKYLNISSIVKASGLFSFPLGFRVRSRSFLVFSIRVFLIMGMAHFPKFGMKTRDFIPESTKMRGGKWYIYLIALGQQNDSKRWLRRVLAIPFSTILPGSIREFPLFASAIFEKWWIFEKMSRLITWCIRSMTFRFFRLVQAWKCLKKPESDKQEKLSIYSEKAGCHRPRKKEEKLEKAKKAKQLTTKLYSILLQLVLNS